MSSSLSSIEQRHRMNIDALKGLQADYTEQLEMTDPLHAEFLKGALEGVSNSILYLEHLHNNDPIVLLHKALKETVAEIRNMPELELEAQLDESSRSEFAKSINAMLNNPLQC